MKGGITLFWMCMTLLALQSTCQFSPIWQASPYIQSRNLVIVSNGQKVIGVYTLPVLFSTVLTNPKLALTIPQLRIINGNSIGFKQFDTNLLESGFTHNLDISGSTTIIYYMICRYTVFNTAVLSQEFQTYYKDNQAGASIMTGPSATTRSSNFSVTLTPAPIQANSPICMAFLSGVTATSNDHYQLNITCTIDNPTSAIVMATVFPSTMVASLNFYVVVWDPVILAAQSYLFVDYTTTSTYYNVQKSALSLPYGYLDKGYCGGMASFSTFYQQELNYTLSNLTLSTSQTSLYDSAPQFQVRVRNCSSSISPFYNSADGLCYPICPSYNYSVSGAFLCSPCPVNCVSCLNSSICTSCSAGMIVVNNSCACANSSYLWGSICVGCHYSCLTCAATGQYYNCLSCQPAYYRSAVLVPGFNSRCDCNTGYNDTGTAKCTQYCGDGNARTDYCDDGNPYSGDGCSSTCTLQANFTCTKNGTNFSSCFYTGNVTIQFVKTFKEDYENVFRVFLKVSPWISNMYQLANSVSLTTNHTKVSPVEYSVDHNLLVVKFTYEEEIDFSYMTVFLKPFSPGIFSILPPSNCTFLLDSDNGYELRVYTKLQYQVASSFHYIAMIMGILILVSAFLFIFGRLKWMGNLLFFSLQFQYLSMVIIPRFTPMLSGLSQIKSVMGYNQIFGQEQFDLPKYASVGVLNFNKQYDYNVNVMVALQGLALFMYLFYHITYSRNELVCKKYGGDPEKTYRSLRYGKFLAFFDWEFFMFWTFFNMINQLVATILFTQLPQSQFLPLIAFNIFCMVLAIAPLLVRRKKVKSYTQLLYCHDRGHEESLVSLAAYLLMFALLGVALTVSKTIYYVLFIFPVAMIAYVCCRRPFQSKWMRAAYFVNCFCMFTMLLYNLLVIAFQDTVYYLPFGSLITILFDWIFNLVVWGRQAYVICKYGGERDLNELLASNTKTSSNDDNADDFFKDKIPQNPNGNQSFLNSIIKNQSKTKRPSRRDQFDEDTPSGIKQQQMAHLQQQEQQQRNDIKKRRENWVRQMKDMKESRIKQRTRHQVDGLVLHKAGGKTRVRSTAQKGINEAQMQSVL